MLDWVTCVKTFNKIVETGSFAGTARKLHTTPSAISKRVAWLEDTMSVPLFRRSTRQVNLTEAGQALYERSVPLLNEWEEIKQAVSTQHHEPNGTLHLGVPVGFGNRYIVSMLPGFIEKYPQINVDLKLSSCVNALVNEQIDLFVCHEVKIQNPDKFHIHEITKTSHQIYASPGYIKKYGKPKTPRELQNHNCIMLNCEGTDMLWDICEEPIPISGNLRTNNSMAAIAACVAGIGIMSMCPYLVKKEVGKGELISLFPDLHLRKRTKYAFYPKQKFIPKKTVAFLEYMKAYFEE